MILLNIARIAKAALHKLPGKSSLSVRSPGDHDDHDYHDDNDHVDHDKLINIKSNFAALIALIDNHQSLTRVGIELLGQLKKLIKKSKFYKKK